MGTRIIGTGRCLPSVEVDNDTLLRFLGPPLKPGGDPITGAWLEEHFGIRTRRFDFDFAAGRKLRPEEGGLFDNDLATGAVEDALNEAGISAQQLDSVVHVSCTPDRDPRCLQNMIGLARKLGLRSDADLDHHNLGCAGLAKGLRSARASIAGGLARYVAVVASNTTSPQLVRANYVDQNRPGFEWAWLSPTVFADGSGAMVLTDDAPAGSGLLATAYETHPEIELVRFPGGGGLNPTCLLNAFDHAYVMDARAVSTVFEPLMKRNLEMLRAATRMEARDFDWVLVHQANGPLVRAFGATLGLPESRVPTNIERYGNTSSASTLLLLDELRKSGDIKAGQTVLFLWIGAGVGAMNGFAAFRM